MKVDIEEVANWIGAIRDAKDRDRMMDCFWKGQLGSKEWLVHELRNRCHMSNPKILICGGWMGVLASILFENWPVGHITNIDIDEACRMPSVQINKRNIDKYDFECVNMLEFEHYDEYNVIINTSAEHLTQSDYMKWLHRVPDDALLVIQSNNAYQYEDHVNCCRDLDEFNKMCGLAEIKYIGEQEFVEYNRFMAIGRK